MPTENPDFSNRTRRLLARLDRFPAVFRPWLRSWIIGRTIPLVGTAGLRVEALEPGRAVVSLACRPRVQNHIGTIHAAGTALVAETATGLLVGMNVHDGAVPVLKRMEIDYLKRSRGGLRAVATLGPELAGPLQNLERGEVTVPVTVTDEDGREPVACRMVWAWVPPRPTLVSSAEKRP